MDRTDVTNDGIQPWVLLESKELFRSKRIELREHTCQLPGGRIIDDYLVATLPDGAAVVAVTQNQEIVLVRQYKHGLGKIVLELPAGNVEAGEDPAKTIARELAEETGYLASGIEFIMTLASKPARMSAKTHIYFAADVKPVARQKQDDAEIIKIVLIPLKELPALIKRGEIVTETSLAAMMMVWDRLIEAK